MNKKKKYIDIYDTIYGVDIVIVNAAVTLEDLRKKYMYSDDVELDDEVVSGLACTCSCKEKATGKYIILTKFNHCTSVKGINKNLDILNTAAHEATHIVLDIYSFAGQVIDNSKSGSTEHMAYFVGWVTERIYKNWTKK